MGGAAATEASGALGGAPPGIENGEPAPAVQNPSAPPCSTQARTGAVPRRKGTVTRLGQAATARPPLSGSMVAITTLSGTGKSGEPSGTAIFMKFAQAG